MFPHPYLKPTGCRVQGSGFRVQGLGFRVQVLGTLGVVFLKLRVPCRSLFKSSRVPYYFGGRKRDLNLASYLHITLQVF